MNPKLPDTVLVVDDEPHIRRYIALILRQAGAARIVEAADGDTAISLFPEVRPGLVLLDINMPGRSGIETLRELRHLSSECPVVILTSLGSRFAIEESLEFGASGYIRKDTPRQEIVRILLSIVASTSPSLEGTDERVR